MKNLIKKLVNTHSIALPDMAIFHQIGDFENPPEEKKFPIACWRSLLAIFWYRWFLIINWLFLHLFCNCLYHFEKKINSKICKNDIRKFLKNYFRGKFPELAKNFFMKKINRIFSFLAKPEIVQNDGAFRCLKLV